MERIDEPQNVATDRAGSAADALELFVFVYAQAKLVERRGVFESRSLC
jgi:hypothetical protein